MRRQRGFTLIELIIVIAIIGILLGVLIPSWGYFLERARIRTQNNKAKAIFNAAQTVITDLDFAERRYVSAYKNAVADGDDGAQTRALNHLYSQVPNVDTNKIWYYYWDGRIGYRCDASGAKLTASNSGYSDAGVDISNLNIDEWDEKIGNYIKKILDEEMVYKIYVKNYQVQSVVSGRFESDRYIGAYPITTDNLDDISNGKFDIDDVRDSGTKNAIMTNFDLDTSDIPT